MERELKSLAAELKLESLAAGDTLTVQTSTAVYELQVIRITRGVIVESFSDDIKTLQALVRENHQVAQHHLDRLLKCRRQKRALMAEMKK